MESKYKEITIGAPLCSKIKDIYYANKSWNECYKDVSVKFSIIKKVLYNFYSTEDKIDVLKKTLRFDTHDIQEAVDMKDSVPEEEKGKNKEELQKYDKKVLWIPVPLDKPELIKQIKSILG